MLFFTFPRKPSKNIVKTAISSISVQGERCVWNQIEVYTYSWSQARLFKHPKVTEKPTAVCLNPAYCLKASGCGNSLCTHGRSPTHFLRTSELVKPFCFGSWMKDFAVRGGGGKLGKDWCVGHKGCRGCCKLYTDGINMLSPVTRSNITLTPQWQVQY